MRIEFDPAKNAANMAKHGGLSLEAAEHFEWETAEIQEDQRKPYAERRFKATGLMGERLFVVIYCWRADAVRIISLRKANVREIRNYVCQNEIGTSG